MAVEFCTELADTVFQVTALFEDTKRFCGDYLSQKAPQYVITVTERDIDFERQRAFAEPIRGSKRKGFHLSFTAIPILKRWRCIARWQSSWCRRMSF